tara:strand:+ start:841 stop:1680 length:840 start_codon:yes stop_codon:yes gene_type:complete
MSNNIENILKENTNTENERATLMYLPSLNKFIGFINLLNFSFMFKPIGINRTINTDVINKRVKENEDSFLATGKYYDFGNAELVVIREYDDNVLYIIDGQHRLSTMENLKMLYPDRDLFIGVSIYIKDTVAEAATYLKHFQNQYPSDDRLFSANQTERNQLDKVLALFNYEYPEVFLQYNKHILNLINKKDKYYKEPNRPHLSNGMISDFIRNPEVKINKLSDPNITGNDIRIINNKIKENLQLYKGTINHNYIENELKGCYFGIIRKDNKKLIEAINT